MPFVWDSLRGAAVFHYYLKSRNILKGRNIENAAMRQIFPHFSHSLFPSHLVDGYCFCFLCAVLLEMVALFTTSRETCFLTDFWHMKCFFLCQKPIERLIHLSIISLLFSDRHSCEILEYSCQRLFLKSLLIIEKSLPTRTNARLLLSKFLTKRQSAQRKLLIFLFVLAY